MEAGSLMQVANHKRTDVLEQPQISKMELRSLTSLKTEFESNQASIKYLFARAEQQHYLALAVFPLLEIC